MERLTLSHSFKLAFQVYFPFIQFSQRSFQYVFGVP